MPCKKAGTTSGKGSNPSESPLVGGESPSPENDADTTSKLKETNESV